VRSFTVAAAGVVLAGGVHMLCICALLWQAGRRQGGLLSWLVGAGGSWCQLVLAASWWWCNSGLIKFVSVLSQHDSPICLAKIYCDALRG
jgi:hypothetical protein